MTIQNNRKHERIKSLNLSYLCLDENHNIVKQGMGRTLNMSESGILLETYFPVEPEHIIQLTLSLEEDLLDLKGKPIHIRAKEEGKYEIGIEFIEMDPQDSKILKEFVDEGGAPRKPSDAENGG